MNSTNKILDIAERRMRQTGYNAVSYRDIANEIGIKSASLHYHFPKKEDLGTALVSRYSEKFSDALTNITAQVKSPQNNIESFVGIYSQELKQRRLICLCAVLGAEAAGLPERVNTQVNRFFNDNIAWLKTQYEALGTDNPANDAKITLSLLTGAMTISSVNNDDSIFDAAVKSILQNAIKV